MTHFICFWLGGSVAAAGVLLSSLKLQARAGDSDTGPLVYYLFSIVVWPVFAYWEVVADD